MSISLPKRVHDLTGRRFGRLVVVAFAERRQVPGGTRVLWLCKCDCGGETSATFNTLRSGHTQSCGCLHRELTARNSLKHGGSSRAEYMAWHATKRRCRDPRVGAFENYGGRGINICDRWADDFGAFFQDMGPRPSPEHTLDRIDVNGHYEPGNCRWATRKEQANNTRKNIVLTVRGQSKTVPEWAAVVGIKPSAIHRRLQLGWTHEDAVLTSVESKTDKRNSVLLEFGGERKTMKQWSKSVGIRIETLEARLARGWTVERAISTPGGVRAR
jgi:hypothetical protein